jgi:lysophospholipase L1-like esterase
MKTTALRLAGPCLAGLALGLLAFSGCSIAPVAPPAGGRPAAWVGTWATSPLVENKDANTPALADATLRQVVRVSTGGKKLRLRLSNAFGRSGLAVASAELALLADASAPATALKFGGREGMVIPAGATVVSDPAELSVPALADVVVTLRFKEVPEVITGHPGARATSWWRKTAEAAPDNWAQAAHVDRWYSITGLDVETAAPPRAVVLLGDSITDGYGVKPGTNLRWTDGLSRRLRADPATADIGVLNQGIGGNRLLRDGLGPNILARFERDVLAQTGVRWLVVFAGINDIGTRLNARKTNEPYASAADIIGALDQVAARAHAAGIKVYGATITPYGGAGFYWSDDGEADRQTVNRWIRTSGHFDAVIDFDAALRDPADPSRLSPALDSGDHLHPSMAGYAEMARVVDLKLFQP